MLHDKIIAAIRTGCAVLGATLITSLVTLLAGWGVELEVDSTWAVALAGALFGVIVGLYNLAVAWLTEHVWDGFGWLLGINQPPSYVTEDLRQEDGGVAIDDEVHDAARE
jgi:hypothetical protein